MKTTQTLIRYSAVCLKCGKVCDARNAVAWAHNHARTHTGHAVDLALAYNVTAGGKTSSGTDQGEFKL